VFLLQTPGGGGYGNQNGSQPDNEHMGPGTDSGEPDTKKRRTQGTNQTMVGTGSVFEYQRAQESV